MLVEGDGPRLRELTGKVWREALYLTETNLTGRIEDGTSVTHNALRLFRNRPEYRFSGRIHEQIANTLPGYLPERFENTTVRIDHYGYLGEVRDAKDKSRRNLELLEQQVADGVDTPFLHFNLGSEYSALDENERALESFEKAWDVVVARPAEDDLRLPALAVRAPGQGPAPVRAPQDCIARGDEILTFLPRFTDIVFEQALAARALGDEARAATLLETCLEWGDAPAAYTATGGTGTFLALATLGDLRRKQGQLPEARALLERCLVEHPRFLASVDPLAATMLALDADPSEVVQTVHAAVGEVTPAVGFMLALALYEAKAVEAAEAELRGVLRRQPGSAPARLALAEALLSQRRYAEAADEALRIPAGAHFAAEAARTAAFARLAGGDAAGAQDALDQRARAAGLYEIEVQLLDGWRRRVLGEPGPAAAARRGGRRAVRHARGAAARRRRRRVRLAGGARRRPGDPVARAPRAAGQALPAPRVPGVGRRRVDRRHPGGPARRRRAGRAVVGRGRARAARRRGAAGPRGAERWIRPIRPPSTCWGASPRERLPYRRPDLLPARQGSRRGVDERPENGPWMGRTPIQEERPCMCSGHRSHL